MKSCVVSFNKLCILLLVGLSAKLVSSASAPLTVSSPIISNSYRGDSTTTYGNVVKRRPIATSSATQQSQSPSASLTDVSRGGSMWTPQTPQEVSGAIMFLLLDKWFRAFFTANKIPFPSPLGGCIIVLITLLLSEVVRPGSGEVVFQTLAPGAGLLAKWLPVFFVPGLAMLPLAPSMGGSLEVLKVLGVLIIGFFFTLSTSAFSVLTLRKLQGATNLPPAVASVSKSTAVSTPPKPYSPELVRFLYTAVPVAAAVSISASKMNLPWAQPLHTVLMGITTVTGFVWGARLPQHVTKIVHPLVSSTAITLLMTYFIGLVTGTSFLQTVRKYKVGSIAPMKTGAGDILLYLLGPSVVSFAWPMFSRRKVIVDNLLPVVTSMIVASVGGLFGTAAFVRLIAVGGTRVGSRMLRVSLIPRTVTTPLAIAIANILGGDISIAAAAVVLTGIFGATIGGSFLTSLGIHDPVSRGMAIGAAAQGVGVASFINEKEAYPFAAISMVLTAVAATALISIPAIKATLLNIVGGN